jgi:hypothetical protein
MNHGKSTNLQPLREMRAIIAASFMDGKWHSIEAIKQMMDDIPDKLIDDVLMRMAWPSRSGSNRAIRVEKQTYGKTFRYRFYKADKMVSLHKLKEELNPIIHTLKTESGKTQVTVSPGTILRCIRQIEMLLEKLDE